MIETALGVALFVFTVSSLLLVTRSVTVGVEKAKEKVAGQRLTEMGFSLFQNIPFWQIRPLDSRVDKFNTSGDFSFETDGTEYNDFPSLASLNKYLEYLRKNGFDDFKLNVVPLVTDSSNLHEVSEGLTTELREVIDVVAPFGCDDAHTEVCIQDLNGDLDTNDVVMTLGAGGEEDQPKREWWDVRAFNVKLELIKGGQVVAKKSAVINWGQMSGKTGKSSADELRMLITKPLPGGFVHANQSTEQGSALSLVTVRAYPSSYPLQRADSGSPLAIAGYTEPGATVRITAADNTTVLQSAVADSAGFFSLSAAVPLIEGGNYFVAYSEKDDLKSSRAIPYFIQDTRPPLVTSFGPIGNVTSLTPKLWAYVADDTSGTSLVSGIHPGTIGLIVDGVSIPAEYDASTGKVEWTPTTPYANNVAHTLRFQVRDKAGYGVQTGIVTFTPNVDEADTTPPVAGLCSGARNALTVSVTDNESGINPSSIHIYVNDSLQDSKMDFDQLTGAITFNSPSPLSGQTLDYRVDVANNANPPGSITVNCSIAVPAGSES